MSAEEKYADIFNMARPVSENHEPMSMQSRAAQFAAFAALVGFDGCIEEKTTQNTEAYLDEGLCPFPDETENP